MVSYADQKEASPSLRAANCEIVTTFGWSWEAQRSGAIRKPECGLAVPAGCAAPRALAKRSRVLRSLEGVSLK